MKSLQYRPYIHTAHTQGCRSTPLHVAAGEGYADICRRLLAERADPEARDVVRLIRHPIFDPHATVYLRVHVVEGVHLGSPLFFLVDRAPQTVRI